MSLSLIALTMITIGLPDFPQSVANRDEVATVSVIPAKGERQRRIVHLCNWHMVPRELFAKAMTADGKTAAEIDQFYAQHLDEVESVQNEQRSLILFLVTALNMKAVHIEGLMPDEVELFQKRAAKAMNARVKDSDPIEQLFAAIVRRDKLMVGIAGQMNAEGNLKVLPAEDRAAFDAANPVGADGAIHNDAAENETRESVIVKTMLNSGPVSFIVLGVAHNLADNVPNDCEYVRIETKRVAELMKEYRLKNGRSK